MSWKPSSVANPPNKMRTLILIPTETEAAPLRAACPDAPVRIAGVGMAAAAAATARIIAEEHPDRLILAGIAGASDRSVAVCEVVAVAGERIAELPGNTPSAMRPTSFRQDCGPSKAIRPTARESQCPARKLKIWKEPLSWPSAGHSECPAPRCGPCRTTPTTRVRPGASGKVPGI